MYISYYEKHSYYNGIKEKPKYKRIRDLVLQGNYSEQQIESVANTLTNTIEVLYTNGILTDKQLEEILDVDKIIDSNIDENKK